MNKWKDGELIVAEKLNAMEEGIESINSNYEKYAWQTGELITADKLNHMETGVEGSWIRLGPKVTMTISMLNGGARVIDNAVYISGTECVAFENGHMYFYSEPESNDHTVRINDGETKTVTVVFPVYYDESENKFRANVIIRNLIACEIDSWEILNRVNCDIPDDTNYIEVTDINQDASIELTITAVGGPK